MRKKVYIDLSDSEEYKKNHINGMINIPYDTLLNNYSKFLNKNDIYVLYCKSGKLSLRLSTMLSYLGYNTINYKK